MALADTNNSGGIDVDEFMQKNALKRFMELEDYIGERIRQGAEVLRRLQLKNALLGQDR